jgi:peptide/nickel transport system permease protein
MSKVKNDFKRNLKDNPYLLSGIVITGLILLLIVVGLFWMPYEPTMMNSSEVLQGISFKHIMGTDNMGRDVFSRVMYGSRITLLIAMGTVFIGSVVGTIIGAAAGYFGGAFDEVTMRIIDALFAFPSILLALVIVSVFGTGWIQLLISLGIAFVPSYARIVRGEVLRCKNMDYVLNARLQGVSNLRMIFVHILPNVKGVLASSILIGFNNAVLAEAGLSYLGVGSQPPYASLGKMLSDAQQYMFTTPSYVLCPGAVIVLMVLGFAFLGEGISKWK